MITFDIPLLQVLVLVGGVVLPLLVGLVTNRTTDPGKRAILLAVLAVAAQLVAELIKALESGEPYNLGLGLLLGLGTFLIAVGTHYGFWKPQGVSDKVVNAGSGKHLP